MNRTKYSAAELDAMPTLSQGHFDDLKVDTGTERVWLSRCGTDDGMPFDDAVTHEELIEGRWVEVEMYEG